MIISTTFSAILLGIVGPWQILIVLGVLLLPILALISILKNEFKGNDKIVWVLVVLLLPFLGALFYFAIGRSQKLKK